jgi:hypothetical protein
LRKKSDDWASDAGGTTRQFGKVGEVPFEEAQRRFREFLAGDRQSPTVPSTVPVSPPLSSPQPAGTAISQPSPRNLIRTVDR